MGTLKKTVTYSQELLDVAPASLQTCRSLLQFLDKKLEPAVPPAPLLILPEWTDAVPDIKERVEKYLDMRSRFEGLTAGGWDARAKRIINVAEILSSEKGKQALGEQGKKLEA